LAASSTRKDDLAIKSQSTNALIPSIAKIERGPDGKILRVIHAEVQKPNPLQDPLNDLASESEDEVEVPMAKTDIVRRLEEQARNAAPKKPRKQSTREAEWVAQLVAKYADDYTKLVRDRRLNPMQQSEGDLKRRVRRWRESRV
jgi:nucleolar protein 16